MKKQSWDNPPDWYGKKNYLISDSRPLCSFMGLGVKLRGGASKEPGKYSLRHGHLRRSVLHCPALRAMSPKLVLARIRDSPVLVVTDLAGTPVAGGGSPRLLLCFPLRLEDHTLVGHERDPENKLLEATVPEPSWRSDSRWSCCSGPGKEFRNVWLGEYALNGSAKSPDGQHCMQEQGKQTWVFS